MRILFAHECFGAFAGVEENVLATATELKRRGHVVGILHGPTTGRAEADWEETFGDRFALTPEDSPAVVNAALEGFQPDVVYVHRLTDTPVLAALTSAGLPLVRMLHDPDLSSLRSLKSLSLTRRICRRASLTYRLFPLGVSIPRKGGRNGFSLKWGNPIGKRKELEFNRQFHRLVVNSYYMQAELMRNGFPAEKIELHPRVAPDGDAGFCSSFSDRNLIVYAGQIACGKGVDVLLEALAGVRVPFDCAVLGDGNHRAACEQLSRKLGLASRVQFKGYVRSEELKEYYRECSVAVLSSVWPEPFGMVGIEAMRYGLPVVAFDAGSIKEWLVDGRNGFLVPWLDRVAYAARVEALLRDKTFARQLGETGRLLVSEHYDFARYITRLEALFARVVEEMWSRVGA